jgi:hypothetical protein
MNSSPIINTNPFNANVIEVTKNKLYFHFIDIEDYYEAFREFINESITSIWNGILGDNDLDDVLIEIKDWFDGKDYKKKAGFIAEFFCHLYMKSLGYEQHFIFQNLEDKGSMKKGFDGLYQFNDEMWIYESKSSLHTTQDASHNSNIGEAYNDIDKKLQGKKLDNNYKPISPWNNAINHASLLQVSPDKSLIENLNSFKKRFNRKDFENIKNFNVIPSSTIFLEDKWTTINHDDLKVKLERLIKKYKYKKMNILCINKKSIESFIGYIDGKI